VVTILHALGELDCATELAVKKLGEIAQNPRYHFAAVSTLRRIDPQAAEDIDASASLTRARDIPTSR
jgi:hypothetical protein